MPLKVIGSGLGRTGTKSMQTALAMLGFGPCHHMVEVFAHPETVPLWIAAGAGKADWDKIFAGYIAMVDYPGAFYWRELAAYYPSAKILHTERDPDKWFDSTQATIFGPSSPVVTSQGPMADFFGSFLKDISEHFHDRTFMTAHFRKHNEEVRRTISAECLLIYEAGQGWEPLCKFLGVPIPNAAYPSENSTADFRARVAEKKES